MQIGEMLVRAGAMKPADVEEAVSQQVLFGGRLGTNMLELGLVEEKALAEALGRQLGAEWMFGEIQVPESMVQMVPAVMARRHEMVPWKLDGKRLKIICASPAENVAMFDEIGFRTGKLVKPVVAPEFRVQQVLRRAFGSVKPMRALDFGVKPKGKRQLDAEKKAEEKALEQQADLLDDDAFAAIYADAMMTRPAPAPAAAPAPVARPAPIEVRSAPPPAAPTSQAPAGWTSAPGLAASQARPSAPPVAPPVLPVRAPVTPPVVVPPPQVVVEDESTLLKPVEDEEILEGEILEAELIEDEAGDGAQLAAAFQAFGGAIEEEPKPVEDLSPLSFKEAIAEIGKASGREAVARAVLRYARSTAARALFLNVQGDVAMGWDAVGEELDQATVRAVAFPLTVPSAFRLVRESRSHYIGPLGKDVGNVRFLKLAGKKWPASAVLLPILFRGKVVYILYVDNGHKQHVNADVGELLILSQHITRSMEQMVANRQKKA